MDISKISQMSRQNMSRSPVRYGYNSPIATKQKKVQFYTPNTSEINSVNDIGMDDSEEDQQDEIFMDEGTRTAISRIKTAYNANKSKFNFQQLNLQDLRFLKEFEFKQLKEINISKNLISNIDILYQYQNLRFVNASFNYIETVNLNLPKLQQLNLQSNYLKKFPIFHYSNNLKILILNCNHIESFDGLIAHLIPNLEQLDVGNNRINFDDINDFLSFQEKIQYLNKLTSLILRGNDFLFKRRDNEYSQQFKGVNIQMSLFNNCKNLYLINNEDVDEVAAKVKLEQEVEGNRIIQKQNSIFKKFFDSNQDDYQTIEKKQKQPSQKQSKTLTQAQIEFQSISLKSVVDEIEQANAYSSRALGHLQNLASKVDLILLNKEKLNEFFVTGLKDQQIVQLIDSFMMNAQMIILNSAELQGIVLSILAKLSIFEFMNLGAQCFFVLKDVMRSGTELRIQVATVIQNEIIVLLKEQDPLKIPKTVFHGIIDLINDDVDNAKILSPKIESRFYQWIFEYCKVLDVMKVKNLLMPDNENYDALIQLFSVIVYGFWTENELKENERYISFITQIFRQSKQENKRYIPCIKIISRLSNQFQFIADKFVISFVHIDLIDELQKNILIYKKSNSLFSDTSKETVQEQMYQYQTFSAEIIALGSLLNSERRISFINHQIIKDIIYILSHQKTDPILLTAVCKFSFNLFKQKELKYDINFMTPFLDQICNLTFIMPYLGGEMYFELLNMSNRYHQSQKQLINVNKSTNQKQQDKSFLDISRTSQASKKKKQEKEEVTEEELISQSLSNIDDWIVNDLFTSIINLIQFFQEEAQTNDKNPLFKDVQENLNQNDREDHLFAALLINNKNVQIGVVNCLFAVPLDGFDDGEVSQMVNKITSCKNISNGSTELIISTVFWILTKFLFSYENEDYQEVCINFQTKYAKKIIFSSLDILSRNLERKVEDEEELEKYTLSLSIINFLKAASGNDCPLMHQHIRSTQNHKSFKQIMINEDLHSSNLINKYPIDIENTKISEDIDCIIQLILGDSEKSLHPYSDVSLRILIRIADILMYQNNRQYTLIQGTDKAQKQLFDFQEKIYKQQKFKEMGIWIDQQNFVECISDIDQMDFIRQHSIFTKQKKVVNLLIEFLVSKIPQNEILLNQMSDQLFNLDIHMNKIKHKTSIIHQIKEKTVQAQQKFTKKYQNKNDPYIIRKYMHGKYQQQSELYQNNLQTEINDDDDYQNNEHYLFQTNDIQFYNQLSLGQVGEDYENKIDKDEKVNNEEKDTEADQNKEDSAIKQQDFVKGKKHTRNDGFLNFKLRSLTVAVFLRCIYSSIEFAPTMNLRIQAIKNLNNDEILFNIAQLCDSVDWDENTCIGAKYLRIMRHFLQLPFHKIKEDINKISNYYLIANVIQKLLKKIIFKLKNEIYLTDGDKITNYEISYTFCLILKQTNFFVFSYSDIVDIHRLKERQIKNERRDISTNEINEDYLYLGGTYKEIYDTKTKKFLKKCQAPEIQVSAEQSDDYKNFQVSIPLLMQKRSVQEKMIEHLVLSLFSKESIFSLLEILFKDMTYKNKIYDQAMKLWAQQQKKDEDEDLDNNQYIQQQDFQEKYSLDQDEELLQENKQKKLFLKNYINVKEVITIERIKDILSEVMYTCQKQMKYQILEKIVKGVIFENKKIRETFIQELLSQADQSQYRTTLQQYLNQNELIMKELTIQKSEKDDGSSYLGSQASKRNFERVIFCCKLDTNHVLKKLLGIQTKDADQPQIEDDTFFKRIFVISNRGIQILRDVDSEDICDQCPPFQFCSRGPQPDISIQFDQIQAIVNFPNIPQKIVIIYMTKDEVKNWNSSYSQHSQYDLNQSIYFIVQLTLNISSYSISSEIYNRIRQIMIEIESKKQKSENINYDNIFQSQKLSDDEQNEDSMEMGPKEELQTQFTSYTDRQMYYDIKLLLSQFDRSFNKKEIKKMKLFFVGIEKTNFVGENYFKQFIQSKVHQPSSYNQVIIGNLFTKKWQIKAQSQHRECSNFKNGVYIGISGKFIFFIKEKWSNWRFEQNQSKIERYFRQLKNVYYDKIPNAQTCKSVQQFNKEMEDYCIKRFTPILQLLFCIQLDMITQIQVHKDRDPSIQITINQKDEKKNEEGKKYFTKIVFGSDMERQTFVDIMWEWHEKNAMFKGEKEEDDPLIFNEESDSDDQDATVINYY